MKLIKNLYCCALLTVASAAGAADLTIHIDDVKSAEGQLVLPYRTPHCFHGNFMPV